MDITFYAGDSRNLIINVVDQDNNPVILIGATIKWVLVNSQGSSVISKSVGSGITINNASGGQFTISLSVNDTKGLSGNFQHIARVTTSDGSSSIVLTGTITVQPSLI